MANASMKTLMSKKAFRTAKKARKMLRKLRKQALKSGDTTTLTLAERLIDGLDKRLAENKRTCDDVAAKSDAKKQ